MGRVRVTVKNTVRITVRIRVRVSVGVRVGARVDSDPCQMSGRRPLPIKMRTEWFLSNAPGGVRVRYLRWNINAVERRRIVSVWMDAICARWPYTTV